MTRAAVARAAASRYSLFRSVTQRPGVSRRTHPAPGTKRSDRSDIPGLTLPVHESPPEVLMILFWLKWFVWLCLRRLARRMGRTHSQPTDDRRWSLPAAIAGPVAADLPPPGVTDPPRADVSPPGFVFSRFLS